MRTTRASRAARLLGAAVICGAALAAEGSSSHVSGSLQYVKPKIAMQIVDTVEHQDAIDGSVTREPDGLSMLLAALAVVCYQLYRKQRFLEQRPLSPTLGSIQ
jgi:hypothetical protein